MEERKRLYRKEVYVSPDPEDYIESTHLWEANNQYHRVGNERYVNVDDGDDLICVNDLHWKTGNNANRHSHRVHDKSECCFGETDPLGKLISEYVYYED